MSDREHSTGCQTASKCDRDRCEFCCECHVRLRGPSGPTAEVMQLRADLARVTKERDALKAGRVLAPWGLVDGFVSFYRCCRGIRMAFVESRVGGPRGVFWGIYMAPHTIGYAPTVEAAKAAADATLVAAGWYLADEGGE